MDHHGGKPWALLDLSCEKLREKSQMVDFYGRIIFGESGNHQMGRVIEKRLGQDWDGRRTSARLFA